VGSGATNPVAFSYAVELARAAFDLGASLGHDMKILDLGGGFSGSVFGPTGAVDLGGVPAALNAALDAYFPVDMGVKVIAEPGRFFAESIATMACLVRSVDFVVDAMDVFASVYGKLTFCINLNFRCLAGVAAPLPAAPPRTTTGSQTGCTAP
jgi:diaminopimelate decarboxylase